MSSGDTLKDLRISPCGISAPRLGSIGGARGNCLMVGEDEASGSFLIVGDGDSGITGKFLVVGKGSREGIEFRAWDRLTFSPFSSLSMRTMLDTLSNIMVQVLPCFVSRFATSTGQSFEERRIRFVDWLL